MEARVAKVIGRQPGVELWLPVGPPEAQGRLLESPPADAQPPEPADADSYTSFPAARWQHWVILEEVEGSRALPIFIGEAEANALGMVLSGQRFARPMAYDLTQEMLDRFGMHVVRIVVERREQRVFYARLHIRRDDREEVFDVRPSDGINMAIRAHAPIFVSEQLLQPALESSEPVDLEAHRVELIDARTGNRVAVLQNGPLPTPGRRIQLIPHGEGGGRVEMRSPTSPPRPLSARGAALWQVVSIEEMEPRLWRALAQQPA